MAPTAPSDARTQGAPRGSATQATEDVAARSPVADGGIAAANGSGGFERGGVSGVHGRSGAGARGLLPPHNSTAPNFTHPAPAQKAESLTAVASVSDSTAPAPGGVALVGAGQVTTLTAEPPALSPEGDLSAPAGFTAAALGVLLGLVIVAACAGLGLWLAGAVFHSGGLG